MRKRLAYIKWLLKGRPVPTPHLAKVRAVRQYAHQFRTPVFIETGTLHGEMVDTVKDAFSRLFSIELDSNFFNAAAQRFASLDHVSVVQGDSGEMIRGILEKVQAPCLFWLDAHYSGGDTAKGALETPIRKELNEIARHPLVHRHVILIDDARCFTGAGDYPSLDKVAEWMHKAGFNVFEVKDDIVRVYRDSGASEQSQG